MPRSKIQWSKWDAQLGLLPDQELADKIGCTRLAVFNRRKLFGLPSINEVRKEELQKQIQKIRKQRGLK